MSGNQTTPAPNQPQVHHVQLVEEKRKNGLGVAALVVGIVAAVFSMIPLIGMVAFFLGPVAIILGLIAVFLKNRKKGTAIAGLVLGIVSLIVAGMMTAAVSAGVKAVDDSINAEHTVEYLVTTKGSADISYWTGGGSSTEKIAKNWKKSITSKDLSVLSLTVSGDFQDDAASVGCEIIVDGKSAAKNTGTGAGAHASCSGTTFGK
jgi:hypothetical protein